MASVVICQFTRKEPELRDIELEDGARSDKHWPSSILNKRRKRRKKSRKKKARDPDLTTVDLESEEIEEVESFEEDITTLQKDGVGTGGGDSGSGLQQQHVDVPKVSGYVEICASQVSLWRPTTAPSTHIVFVLFNSFASTSCSSSYLLRHLFIANTMSIKLAPPLKIIDPEMV